jgi:hypothetical protein
LETFLFGRNFAEEAIVSTEEDRHTKTEQTENACQPRRRLVNSLLKKEDVFLFVLLLLYKMCVQHGRAVDNYLNRIALVDPFFGDF